MKKKRFVLGLDYGTDSVRALITDALSGEEISSAVSLYPRWKEGKYCDAGENRFRQHPLDYQESLEKVVNEALEKAPVGTSECIEAISIDTTGSTPVAVDEKGVPLALTPDFKDNPDAMFVLWKDHTAIAEAEEINHLTKSWGGTDYTKYCGGLYSSEWFWAKILHIIRSNDKIKNAAFSWVEHCDWLPALLTGNSDPLTLKRSRCAAGHKAMWHKTFNGLPSEKFLSKLDPYLASLRNRLYSETYTADTSVGTLSPEWAGKLGLPENVMVGVGAFDAHIGAVGAEIKPGVLCKVMGTSTCDMLISPLPASPEEEKIIKGICGQVDGSVIPGFLGLEAGQSAFGDIYAWFVNILTWPAKEILMKNDMIRDNLKHDILNLLRENMIPSLEQEALKIPPEKLNVIAIDWMNGRRTPDANQALKGAVAGLTIGTTPPEIFKALVDATAFGSRAIADRFIAEGVEIKEVIALGGVAKKSKLVMQTVADILNMPIKVVKSEQTCALGACMFASVVAGIHPDITEAQKAMGSGFETTFTPNLQNKKIYDDLYLSYLKLGSFVEQNMCQ